MNALNKRVARLEGSLTQQPEPWVIERVMVDRGPSGELRKHLHSVRTDGIWAKRSGGEAEDAFRARFEIEAKASVDWRANQ